MQFPNVIPPIKSLSMMTKFSIFSLFLLSFFSSCTNETNEVMEGGDFSFESIEFTNTCGWCADGKTISITKDETVSYAEFNSCDPDNYLLTKERALTSEEIDKINAVLNYDTFKNIDHNSCGVCYDGCDDRLTITLSEENSHSILYDDPSQIEDLQDIEELLDILNITRNEFN